MRGFPQILGWKWLTMADTLAYRGLALTMEARIGVLPRFNHQIRLEMLVRGKRSSLFRPNLDCTMEEDQL